MIGLSSDGKYAECRMLNRCWTSFARVIALARTRSLESRVPGNWHALFGKRPTEKARVPGTSPAAYFTR
ncbi:MAG TPA: hypothetical protein VFH48_35925, partial [Chloroflexota bacterium]|nr:hypothetical protein [Chloroflexota bacterium]